MGPIFFHMIPETPKNRPRGKISTTHLGEVHPLATNHAWHLQ